MGKIPQVFKSYALETLKTLVAIPTVSAEGRALGEGAQKVAGLLEELGLKTEIHPTAGAPVVYAETLSSKGAERSAGVLLCYNHYDVQPPDPLELWESDPFQMTEREGCLYGRGINDDKGELVSRLAALKWFQEEHHELPFRIKFVVEGEEEVGSPNLSDYVRARQKQLACDAIIWEAGGVNVDGRPLTYTGLKGIASVDLKVKTAAYDLHSSYGAAIQNPIFRLAAALTALRDNNGRILIEGFYDKVRPLTEGEEESLSQMPEVSSQLAQVWGLKGYLGNASGAEVNRRLMNEPALNFNGFHSGYGGPGTKTVLPAEALAKLDIRLIPDQDPDEVVELLKKHLIKQGFDDIEVDVKEVGGHPARSDIAHPFVRMTLDTLREVYGLEPIHYINMPGSGPMHPFVHHLKAPVVGMGVGYPGSRIHSPNENIRIDDFEKGIVAVKRLFERFAGL
jgi:acetylornithine deacetylase/succinyl-diaminopimelate desuccinylase-like protein